MFRDIEVDIVFKKNKRAKKYIIKVVNERNVEVIIPRYGTKLIALDFLNQNQDWIRNRIDKIKLSRVSKDSKFAYLGELLEFSEFLKRAGEEKYLNKMSSLLPEEAADLYEKILKKIATKYLRDRTILLSSKIGLSPSSLKVKKMKRSWGLCSRKGNISLNFKLMKLRPDLIDYVIVHELIHLVEFNHSRAFYQKLEVFLPDYKALQKELKKHMLN